MTTESRIQPAAAIASHLSTRPGVTRRRSFGSPGSSGTSRFRRRSDRSWRSSSLPRSLSNGLLRDR
jgi:hypothetical protein